MKKKVALATLAMLPMTFINVHAAQETGIVTAEILNVRSGPGTNNSIVFTIKKNDTVTIIDSSNGWYKIKLSSGKEGWASGSYISKRNNDDKTSSSGIQKQVSVSRLNMRSGAGTSYRVITTLTKSQKVEVISENNGWSKIKYDGKLGYVSNEYLDNIKLNNNTSTVTSITKQVNTESLNVRSGPNTSYAIVGKVTKGQKVVVQSESDGWSKIDYNGKISYVSSTYLSIQVESSKPTTPSEPITPPVPETIKEKKIVNTEALNVRSGSGTSYGKIGTVYKNTVVEIISESNGWSKILYNNKEAYVSSIYLSTQIESSKPTTPSEPITPPIPETIKEKKIVNTEALNVRSGSGTSYGKIGTVYKNTVVEVISESNGWSKILYNNKEAYVSSIYLSVQVESSKPTIPEIDDNTKTPETNVGGSNSILNEYGSIINYNSLNYTLEQHLNKQYERVTVGGNVIDSVRGFINATLQQIQYFLNTENFINSSKGILQFLRIDSYKGGVSVEELNSYLNKLPSKVFYNQGSAFINAAQKYDIDVVYLVAHAMWETGYGQSVLAKGQTITSYKGQVLEKPATVYNFYGIGAIDKSANVSGAQAAYSNGWTSVEATIDGSAKWISSNYIKSSKYNQNTVYKMKWNYDYTWHQYATDVNWSNGVATKMNEIIYMYDTGNNLTFDIPRYK